MIKKRIIFYLLLLLIIGGVVWAGNFIWHDEPDEIWRTYEGRLYLAADEYEQFKQYLADNPEVQIGKLDVYSSPSALIEMKLTAPANIDVPYGEMTKEFNHNPHIPTILKGALLFAFSFLGFSVYYTVRRFTIVPRWI